jgi:hypothetical protein
LARSGTTKVGGIRVKGVDKFVEHPQRQSHAEQDVNAHRTIAALKVAKGGARNPCTLGHLQRRETLKFSPHDEMVAYGDKTPLRFGSERPDHGMLLNGKTIAHYIA